MQLTLLFLYSLYFAIISGHNLVITPYITKISATSNAFNGSINILPINRIKLNSSLNLTCNSIGHPSPFTTWYKDGTVTSNTDDVTLSIPSFNLTHRGLYHCSVNSSAGVDTSMTFILDAIGIRQYRLNISVNYTQVNVSSITSILKEKLTEEFSSFLSIERYQNFKQNNYEIFIVTLLSPQNVENTDIVLKLHNTTTDLQDNFTIYINDIQRFDGCPSQTLLLPSPDNKSTLDMTITWPETNIGHTATVQCPCGSLNLTSKGLVVTRYCGGNFNTGAVWRMADVSVCEFSSRVRRICSLSQEDIPGKINGLLNVSSQSESLESIDIQLIVSVLSSATNSIYGNLTLSSSYLAVINNILAANRSVIETSQRLANTSSILLKGINTIAEGIPIYHPTEPVLFNLSSFAVSVQEINLDNFTGMTLLASIDEDNRPSITSIRSARNITHLTTTSVAEIKLPRNILNNETGKVVSLVFVEDSLFLTKQQNQSVTSVIMSVSVNGVGVHNITNPPIDVKFSLKTYGALSVSIIPLYF